MSSVDEVLTAAIKACSACGVGLLERDKFCRLCGVRQSDRLPALTGRGVRPFASTYTEAPIYRTAAIERQYGSDPYSPVSGPLIKAVVAGVSAKQSTRPLNRSARQAVLALLSIPIWLIIVLLSPLDAYAAAKALSRQI